MQTGRSRLRRRLQEPERQIKNTASPFRRSGQSDNFQSLPIILSFGKENQHVREICRTISVSCKSKRICRPRHQPRLTKRFQRVLSSNRIAKKGPFSKKVPLSFSLFKTRKRIRAVSGKTNYPAFDAMSRLPASGSRTFAREQPHFIAGRTPRRCCVRQ